MMQSSAQCENEHTARKAQQSLQLYVNPTARLIHEAVQACLKLQDIMHPLTEL